MKHREVVDRILMHCRKEMHGHAIEPGSTRDRFLYGDPDCACTGIIVTCYASIHVLEEAVRRGANLVLCHESMFYFHGDRTDWLKENQTFLKKKRILDEGGLTVFRFHDHIHAGIETEPGVFCDGIFHGIMRELEWESYLVESKEKPLLYRIPTTTVRSLAMQLMSKGSWSGVKVIGDLDGEVSTVWIVEHVQGREDDQKIERMETDQVDVVLPLELVDHTITEYVFDSAQSGHSKAILAFGHFNLEELGMKGITCILDDLLQHEVPIAFVQAGDLYQYVKKEGKACREI